MNTITQSTTRLVDIVAPHSPTTTISYGFALAIIAALLLTAVCIILWNRHYSKSQAGLRQLKLIQHDLNAQRLTPRMACYRIAVLYKQWLSLNHLPNNCILPKVLSPQQPTWNKHLQRLHALRYSTQRCTEQDVKELITETCFWLKRLP